MATETLEDVNVTGEWVDLVDTHGALAGVDATIQNVNGGAVAVVWSPDPIEPDGKSGTVLGPRDSTTGLAAHVFARAIGASGTVSVTLL